MTHCYVALCGGLGNQLFQIAAGYSYSKRYNKVLYIDSSKWNGGQGKNGYDYKNTIFKNFEYCEAYGEDVICYHEPIYNHTEIPLLPNNISLHGYFQSYKYFNECQNEFKELLILPNTKMDLDSLNVAFHIRRGDYLYYPHIYNICDTTYFDKCFDLFKGYQINVFTDSPEYVLNEFNHQSFNLIKTSSELHDLTLISKHKNIVCSNSTFSWWGSFLGEKKDSIIVPSKWFIDGREHDDIYREDMIKI